MPLNLWHRHPGVRSGEQLTFGERAADKVRNGMGSWWFVFGALLFLAGWMTGNRNVGFDPYPFILLNLVLSFQAAYTGPVVMMSQNRQTAKDRDAAEHDYRINEETFERLKRLEANQQMVLDEIRRRS
jgi:uncharacterized membrane protein